MDTYFCKCLVSKTFVDINFCGWSVFQDVETKKEKKKFYLNRLLYFFVFVIHLMMLESTTIACITSKSMSSMSIMSRNVFDILASLILRSTFFIQNNLTLSYFISIFISKNVHKVMNFVIFAKYKE